MRPAGSSSANDYVVVGRVTALADGQVRIDAELVNVLTGQRVAGP